MSSTESQTTSAAELTGPTSVLSSHAPDFAASSEAAFVEYEWAEGDTQPEELTIPMPIVPPCIHDFVRAVGAVPNVRCVVIETEGEALHITTFAAPITEATRAAVYEAQRQLIEENPPLLFDFHLRRADEATGATPAPTGSQCLAVWGNLHADEG